MTCPNCGHEQPEGVECIACGIIFAKFRPRPKPVVPPPVQQHPLLQKQPAQAPPAQAAGGDLAQPWSGPAEPPTPYAPPPPATIDGALRERLNVGPILNETFAIYGANFASFSIISGVALSPLLLLLLIPMEDIAVAGPEAAGALILVVFATVLWAVVSNRLVTAAVTYGVSQSLRGRQVTIQDCLQTGMSCLLPVVLVALLSGFGTFFGYLLCVVPGVILSLMWWVAVPVAVEERLNAVDCLRRSNELTLGFKGQIFLVLAAIGAVDMVISMTIQAALPGSFGSLLTFVKDTLATALYATAAGVVYYRLRSAKESVDVDELASIFE